MSSDTIRRTIPVVLDPETIEKLDKIKEKTGIPRSQLLERSFLKIYGDLDESRRKD